MKCDDGFSVSSRDEKEVMSMGGYAYDNVTSWKKGFNERCEINDKN